MGLFDFLPRELEIANHAFPKLFNRVFVSIARHTEHW
jgi:hypothetical protein